MILSRPVAPLARRTALMTASVPELTIRTISTWGTISVMSLAISTSLAVGAPKLRPSFAALMTASQTRWSACPKIIGPQEPM